MENNSHTDNMMVPFQKTCFNGNFLMETEYNQILPSNIDI